MFIVCLSPSTPTNMRIRGTETWSILFYLSLFIPRAWDIPVLNMYLVNELVNGFCLKLGNPEKKTLYISQIWFRNSFHQGCSCIALVQSLCQASWVHPLLSDSKDRIKEQKFPGMWRYFKASVCTA